MQSIQRCKMPATKAMNNDGFSFHDIDTSYTEFTMIKLYRQTQKFQLIDQDIFVK